jgi:hypothetical protein
MITTISGYGLCVRLRALFCARTGRWESVGRAEEESRLAPAMLQASENKPELVSLVGKSETLADSIISQA